MAYEIGVLDVTFTAAEDLSSNQYRFVVLTTSDTVRRPDSETEGAIGILQNDPAAGEEAQVRVLGISKCHANGALGIGTYVMPEYVSATDAGKCKASVGAPAYTRGVVVFASGAEDDLCSVLLGGFFPGITDAISSVATVTTDVTAGPNTWTAAELIGGILLRDPTGAARSDVTPTAAAIVAGITGAIVSSAFDFFIVNQADDASEIVTLTAGAGVTLTGTMTIPAGSAAHFRAVCTNVTGAADAVTIYREDDMHHSTVGSLIDVATVSTITTAGAGTYSAANLLGGLILRDPNGASRADTLPLATAIIAAMAGQNAVHNSFKFSVRNAADDASEIITVTTNTGITLSGAMTVAPGKTASFLVVQTAATTVSIYRLGAIVHSALGNLVDTCIPATEVTGGAVTLTVAQMLGGLILRDPAGADRADIVPLATAIIAAMTGQAGINNSFEFVIRNDADADETITLTANTGVTLSGTMTIPWHTSRRFRCVVTGAATCTIYDLTDAAHKIISVPLKYVAATAVVTGCIAVTQKMLINSITYSAFAKVADADGTCVLAVENYDSGSTATDSLLVAATWDMESYTTAKISQDLALTATAADLLLENGDTVFATLTPSATPDTVPSGDVLTFDVTLL